MTLIQTGNPTTIGGGNATELTYAVLGTKSGQMYYLYLGRRIGSGSFQRVNTPFRSTVDNFRPQKLIPYDALVGSLFPPPTPSLPGKQISDPAGLLLYDFDYHQFTSRLHQALPVTASTDRDWETRAN